MTETICPTCGGNGKDAPCLYPSENKPGCLGATKLSASLDLKGSVILEFGLGKISEYTAAQYERALKNTFRKERDPGAVRIILDSYPVNQRFKAAASAWGLVKGYLYVSGVADGEQDQVTALKLTEEGLRWING